MVVWVDNVYLMTRNSGTCYLYACKAGNLTKTGCVCTNIVTLPYTPHTASNFWFFIGFRKNDWPCFFKKIDFPIWSIAKSHCLLT